jgi:hypothetical protein
VATQAEVEAGLVRESPAVWFELHGCILDKKRKKVKAPDLAVNRMQAEIDAIIRYCRVKALPARIVTLKGRQQGSTTFSIAAAYQMAQAACVKVCIIGDEYEKSVANCEAMFDNYAAEDSFRWGHTYTKSSGKFSHGSELVTETANDPRAGASGTMQCVICTEVAHWKETTVISGKATFAALLNCVPEESGTLIIVESTPNGTGGVYYTTYQGAITLADHSAGKIPENWNGFFRVFYPWWQHPEYVLADISEHDRSVILDSLGDREIELMAMDISVERLAWRRKILKSPRFDGDAEVFEQEYPADEDTCFLTSGRRFFAAPSVQGLRRRAREAPVPEYGVLGWANDSRRVAVFAPTAPDDAFLKVWERPLPGLRYNLPVDPMTGATGLVGADPDNHGAGIMRGGYFDREAAWRPLMLAARLADCWAERRHKRSMPVCRWDIEVLTERAALLAAWYGGATVTIETNMDKGLTVLLRANYPDVNLYRRVVVDRVRQTTATVYGWKTDVATRAAMLELLARRVRLLTEVGDGIEVLDDGVIGELGGFIVRENGRPEAMAGFHDDQVFMLALGAATMDAGHVMAPVRRGKSEWDDDDVDLGSRDMSYT